MLETCRSKNKHTLYLNTKLKPNAAPLLNASLFLGSDGLHVLVHVPVDDGGAVVAGGGVALLPHGRAPHADGQGQAEAARGEEGEEAEAQAGVQAIQRTKESVRVIQDDIEAENSISSRGLEPALDFRLSRKCLSKVKTLLSWTKMT